MSIINPIKYQVYFHQTEPDQPPPVIDVPSDNAAYGTITLRLSPLSTVTSLSYKSFRLLPPTSIEDRWMRDSTDYINGGFSHLADATGYFNSDGYYTIDWEWVPSVINAQDGTAYSLEFFINGGDATVAQMAPKLILTVKDYIV